MESVPRITILQSDSGIQCTPDPIQTYLARLAPGSRRAMHQVVRVIAAELGGDLNSIRWHELRYAHTQAIRTMLMTKYAPATANRALSALRGVLQEAVRLELMDGNDYRRAIDLRPVRGSRASHGRALSLAEIGALYAACSSGTAQGARDAAAIAVCFGAGLRRAEAVALKLRDFDPDTLALSVTGKGNKHRRVFLSRQSASIVSAWLAVRGASVGPLLLAVDKADRIRTRQLSPEAIATILKRLTSRAGVARASPHDLRRGYVSALLDAGVDLSTVQTLAGHATPTTTARYDRRPEDVQRRAVELVVVPFVLSHAEVATKI